FDDHDQAEREELATELPLEALDPAALVFIPEVEGESLHPLVGRETNRAEPALEPLGQRGLAGARQAAHDDEPRSGTRPLHEATEAIQGPAAAASGGGSRGGAPARGSRGGGWRPLPRGRGRGWGCGW